MQCNIIQDLLPLFADGCCSDESREAVQTHLNECENCRSLLAEMSDSIFELKAVSPDPMQCKRIKDWKASVLQSVLLFISFALITLGVAMEARTPSGWTNGYWAFNLVIPATGFMLSLANWYFIRMYTSRKRFSTASALLTFGITVCIFVVMGFYYGIYTDLADIGWKDFWEAIPLLSALHAPWVISIAVLPAVSKLLSSKYALLLGKE